ncbi:phosphocholine cytidylyltransferase family protein, partial [Candidatus Babeliales bacterium]|nr:phosphocholine cytidylyltransferase family protein [Candidatus Babeliales bacterium]
MKAIILAAGEGKRLKPLTDNIPKTLIEINGETILERSINTLKECGIKNVIVVAGYLSEKVENVIKKHSNVEMVYNEYYNTTDNMYSVMLCEDKCIDEPVLIMNGDLIVSKSIIQKSLDVKHSNIPIDTNPNLKDGQKVIVKDKRLVGIGKKLDVADGTAINIIVLSKKDAGVYFDNINRIIHHEKRPNDWWEVALNESLNKINIEP